MIGRALTRRLLREGHVVTAVVRNLHTAREALGSEPSRIAFADEAAVVRAVGDSDAVINLAGAPIADRAWSAARLTELDRSRAGLTQRIAGWIHGSERRPAVFVCASAVGFYGDRGQRRLSENESSGSGLLADMCTRWEAAADQARSRETRVVKMRLGVVLDAEGGALAKMLPAFRLGLGGRLGNGEQYFPWVHLDDVLDAFLLAMNTPDLEGPVNVTAPEPVTNQVWTHALGEALGKPTRFPVPGWALRTFMGDRSQLMLSSQRVIPARLLEAGFRFRHEHVRSALAEVARRSERSAQVMNVGAAPSPRKAPPGRADYVLEQRAELAAPLEAVFPFFERAENLGSITPPWMDFALASDAPEQIESGTKIEYNIRLGPAPLRWRTRIRAWEPGALFIDHQERGPYRLWWHEHAFEPTPLGTRVVDRVYYRLPFGPLGRLVHRWFVRSTLRRIFAYRLQAMAQRFGIVRDEAHPQPTLPVTTRGHA